MNLYSLCNKSGGGNYMNIVDTGDTSVPKIIKPIDEKIITVLAQQCLQIRKNDEGFNIYSKFYKTRYPIPDLSFKEKQLSGYLQQLHDKYGDMVRTDLQGSEYRRIKVNTSWMGDIDFRFYLAPDPNNMHEIVKNLATNFAGNAVPVKFKYQLQQKMNECDRIIIYSDFEHRDQVEEQIRKVYDNNPELFYGSERPVSWLYGSKIPNVFLAPETPGSSYGQVFADSMLQAKQIFCYFYGITNKSGPLTLDGDEAIKATEDMKTILCSLLFRNGLLLSNDRRKITVRDKDIQTHYDYETGILKNMYQDDTGYHRVIFTPTAEGRNALLNNFYNVSRVQPQNGITVEHLTQDQRAKEIYDMLYGSQDQQPLPLDAQRKCHK